MFRLDNDADINGTSFHDTTIEAVPADLIKLLGDPGTEILFQDKVQLEWSFTNHRSKDVFTLYDWKNYGVNIRLSEKPVCFHIGSKVSKTKETNFKNWLEAQLKG